MSNPYFAIHLVRTDDPEYVAYRRRMAAQRPSRGGPRHAGEYLGGLVEQCVQRWLSGFVPLQEERILTWEQRLRNGRAGSLYRELDGVWTIDHESLCLFEIKFTFPENMERGVGLKQLNIAQDILFASGKYQYILKRMVYVSDDPVTVLEELPVLAPDDENEELGVIWIPTAAIEAAALELEIVLPENWREPESREGAMDDPERDEWKQYADTALKYSLQEPKEPPQAAGEEAEGEARTDPKADNPLAEALRRAMQGKQ